MRVERDTGRERNEKDEKLTERLMVVLLTHSAEVAVFIHGVCPPDGPPAT